MDILAQTDLFFAGRKAQWQLFEALKQAVLSRYPAAQLRVMKTCIVFEDPKPFLYVSIPKQKAMTGLMLSVSLREEEAHPRFYRVVPLSKTRYTVHIHVSAAQEINEELLEWIARSRR